jgi:uncharacterized membrane protein YqjE
MPMFTLGLAALGFLYTFAAVEIWDAYRYREHPTTDLRAELRAWGIVLCLWTLVVLVAAWMEGYL